MIELIAATAVAVFAVILAAFVVVYAAAAISHSGSQQEAEETPADVPTAD